MLGLKLNHVSKRGHRKPKGLYILSSNCLCWIHGETQISKLPIKTYTVVGTCFIRRHAGDMHFMIQLDIAIRNKVLVLRVEK